MGHLLHPDSTRTVRTWKDSKKHPLEEQIKKTLSGFLEEALDIKKRREERSRAEIEHRRQEELRWRQSQRRSANAKLIHEPEAQAGAWFRANVSSPTCVQ